MHRAGSAILFRVCYFLAGLESPVLVLTLDSVMDSIAWSFLETPRDCEVSRQLVNENQAFSAINPCFFFPLFFFFSSLLSRYLSSLSLPFPFPLSEKATLSLFLSVSTTLLKEINLVLNMIAVVRESKKGEIDAVPVKIIAYIGKALVPSSTLWSYSVHQKLRIREINRYGGSSA